MLLCVFIFAGCVAPTKKPPQKHLPKTTPKTTPPTETVEKQKPEVTRTNAKPSTSDVVTPQRQASMRILEKGKTFLDSQEFEKAASIFRDAINVDSSNGIAYFYLADVDSRLGQAEVALGLLDKAEALLGADEEWMNRINSLRAELGAPASKAVVTSPIDQAF